MLLIMVVGGVVVVFVPEVSVGFVFGVSVIVGISGGVVVVDSVTGDYSK